MPSVTPNALRKFLRDSGCLEERALNVAGSGRFFVHYACHTKGGKACHAMLSFDPQDGRIPEAALANFARFLTPCLGRSWIKRIPEEDPFG